MQKTLLLVGVAIINTVYAVDLPWEEKVVSQHLDQSSFVGSLDKASLDYLIDKGEHLFSGKYTKFDGAGRRMATQAIIPTKRRRPVANEFMRSSGLDSNSCGSCHNVPTMGGAGDFTANVFVSEGFNQADFDSLNPQFSNERNSNHLFGSGLIELLAREMSEDLHKIRRKALIQARKKKTATIKQLITKGISFGQITAQPNGVIDLSKIEGVDTDLVIRPFSQKGVMTSLRQFSINALNHHHGMQAVERFGERWTGENDFDQDGVTNELSAGDVSALVAWQAALPPPTVNVPEQSNWKAAAKRGKHLFQQNQCSQCHVPALPLRSLKFSDPGEWDMAGTLRSGDISQAAVYDLNLLKWSKDLPRNEQGEVMVPLFGDLKRHRIADSEVSQLGNELLSQRFVARNVFITAELWGVGSTAPYGHRGDLGTLDEVIQAHGGEGRSSRDAYLALDKNSRLDIIAFLKTLAIE